MVYEEILGSALCAKPCESEDAFYQLWHEHGINEREPIDQAVVGGAISSSLPWVFTAGYQATLRNAFSDLPATGWAAFIATEDSQQPDIYPGTKLAQSKGELRLDGHKLWVAHSKRADHLIVTVNDDGGDKYKARGLIIERARPGITLTHRNNPGFLNKLSQGFAKFENTPVQTHEVFEFEPIRQFGRTEAKFVMLASVSFMLSHAIHDQTLSQRLLGVGTALESLIRETETSRVAYGAIDREFQFCVDAFEQTSASSAIADYENDKRLFRMYSDRIQRRADRARQKHSAQEHSAQEQSAQEQSAQEQSAQEQSVQEQSN